eukprot:476902-Rhodomonas_salina.9
MEGVLLIRVMPAGCHAGSNRRFNSNAPAGQQPSTSHDPPVQHCALALWTWKSLTGPVFSVQPNHLFRNLRTSMQMRVLVGTLYHALNDLWYHSIVAYAMPGTRGRVMQLLVFAVRRAALISIMPLHPEIKYNKPHVVQIVMRLRFLVFDFVVYTSVFTKRCAVLV